MPSNRSVYLGYAKGFGGCLFAFAVPLALLIIYLRGLPWIVENVVPWLGLADLVLLVLGVLVFAPLSFIASQRAWAGTAIYGSSYVFGVTLFIYSTAVVLEIWGLRGLIVGLVLAGVGVVPVALLAAIFHAQWITFLYIVIGIILTYGARMFGLRQMAYEPDTVLDGYATDDNE